MNTAPLTRSRPNTKDRTANGPTNRDDTAGPGRRSSPRLRGRFTRNPATAARDELAHELHSVGATYPEVAEALGYATPAAAGRAATRARLDKCLATVATARAEQYEQLERLEEIALRVVEGNYVRMYRGRPVLTDPDDPSSTIPDYRPIFRATDVCLRIMDRKAKLFGLYAAHSGPRIGARR